MRRILVLAGLLGAAALGARRLLEASPGTLRNGTQRAAEFIRRRGPSVAEEAARGVEQLGEVAEKGAERVRERLDSGEEEKAARYERWAKFTGDPSDSAEG